jgi:polar amino acid transport system substrate-binding protein
MKIFGTILAAFVAMALTVGAALSAKAESVIDDILERGKIIVGLSTFVPWAMRDKEGNLIGFEIDVARQLAEDMGVEVEFVPTAFDGIIPALLAGKFDIIITGIVLKPQRNLTVNFSDPYAYLSVGMAANKKMAEEMGLKTLEDWNNPDVILTIKRGTAPGETHRPCRTCLTATHMPS